VDRVPVGSAGPDNGPNTNRDDDHEMDDREEKPSKQKSKIGNVSEIDSEMQ
jgi:hypothetical protein